MIRLVPVALGLPPSGVPVEEFGHVAGDGLDSIATLAFGVTDRATPEQDVGHRSGVLLLDRYGDLGKDVRRVVTEGLGLPFVPFDALQDGGRSWAVQPLEMVNDCRGYVRLHRRRPPGVGETDVRGPARRVDPEVFGDGIGQILGGHPMLRDLGSDERRARRPVRRGR